MDGEVLTLRPHQAVKCGGQVKVGEHFRVVEVESVIFESARLLGERGKVGVCSHDADGCNWVLANVLNWNGAELVQDLHKQRWVGICNDKVFERTLTMSNELKLTGKADVWHKTRELVSCHVDARVAASHSEDAGLDLGHCIALVVWLGGAVSTKCSG